MSRLTITDAINHSPVGRTQFYKEYINTGKITVSVDERKKKYIDSSELLRVFGTLSENVRKQDAVNPAVLPPTVLAPVANDESEIVKLLKEQLSELRADTKQREEHYQNQIVSLTNRLESPTVQRRPNPFVRWWCDLDK